MNEPTQLSAKGVKNLRYKGTKAQSSRSSFAPLPLYFCVPLQLCALVFLCCCALVTISGCGQNEPPSVKESRTLAAENMSLKKQLERQTIEMDLLKEKHSREVERLEKRIADYRKQRDDWQERAQQNIRNQTKDVADTVMAENAKLRAENEQLKAQIDKLREGS